MVGLAALAAEAPTDATLVMFHSAVLAYFPAVEREKFVQLASSLPGHWISIEGQTVVPGIREYRGRAPVDPGLSTVTLNGNPVAFAGSHGQSLEWVG